jgi:hypothetical protein
MFHPYPSPSHHHQALEHWSKEHGLPMEEEASLAAQRHGAAEQRPLLVGAKLLALAAARPATAAAPEWEALAAELGLMRAESLDELAYVLGPEGALVVCAQGCHVPARHNPAGPLCAA